MSNPFHPSIIPLFPGFLFMILFLGWFFRLDCSLLFMYMYYFYIVANILPIIDSHCERFGDFLVCHAAFFAICLCLVLLFFSISIISSLSSSFFMEVLRLSNGFSTGPVHMNMKCIQHCFCWRRILW